MASRGYHHGSLHQTILAAAVEGARRGGPAAISVRSLAKAAEVSPSAIYRHVPNLNALLAEVAQVARERLAEFIIERREALPPRRASAKRARERFAAIGRGYVGFALAEPHLFDTAFTPTTEVPQRPDDPSAWQVLVDGVTELVEAGVLRAEGADDAALIAWSGVHGIASILVRQALPEEHRPQDAIDAVLDGVMRSLESL